MLNNKDNLWILTEERPKKEVIKKIIEKTNNYKNLSIKIENFKIEPVIKDNKFLHIFKISQVKSKKIDKTLIELRNHYQNTKVPIMPVGADLLIKKYEIPEGKYLGDKLKKIEEEWVKNNFKISDQQIDGIINN